MSRLLPTALLAVAVGLVAGCIPYHGQSSEPVAGLKGLTRVRLEVDVYEQPKGANLRHVVLRAPAEGEAIRAYLLKELPGLALDGGTGDPVLRVWDTVGYDSLWSPLAARVPQVVLTRHIRVAQPMVVGGRQGVFVLYEREGSPTPLEAFVRDWRLAQAGREERAPAPKGPTLSPSGIPIIMPRRFRSAIEPWRAAANGGDEATAPVGAPQMTAEEEQLVLATAHSSAPTLRPWFFDSCLGDDSNRQATLYFRPEAEQERLCSGFSIEIGWRRKADGAGWELTRVQSLNGFRLVVPPDARASSPPLPSGPWMPFRCSYVDARAIVAIADLVHSSPVPPDAGGVCVDAAVPISLMLGEEDAVNVWLENGQFLQLQEKDGKMQITRSGFQVSYGSRWMP